ncbi:MAG: Holliday junction resolvase RuvX [Clostridiales Family XIII bacterium]|nr:Holliday junction resolvase RuvX [Clostridiales Family XIII bacterium]
MENKKTLGLDVGDARIGVAVSDALGLTAQGLFVLECVGIRKDTTKILDTVIENGCSRVVIGLPIMLDGSDSEQTRKVRAFADALSNKLRSNGLPDVEVAFHDERFSTKIAEAAMIEGGLRREKRKEIVDRQAAVVILQDYLNTHT